MSNTQTPVEFFTPNRGWFMAPAGAIGGYILYKLDAALSLAIVSFVVLLGCALIWPWIEKTKRRQAFFWVLLSGFTLTVIVTLALRRTGDHAPVGLTLATPTPILSPSPISSPLSQVTPTPSPSPSPAVTPTPT